MISGQLAAAERERIAGLLTESRDLFLASIRDLSQAQWNFKLSEDIWSIAECCDHVGGAESLFLNLVKSRLIVDPVRAEAVQGKEKIVHKAVSNRQIRVKVPVPIAPFDAIGTPQEFELAFAAARQTTLEYVHTTQDPLHAGVYKHFVLGDFDGAQWLELIAAHCLRHRDQIEEVKSSAGYPQA